MQTIRGAMVDKDNPTKLLQMLLANQTSYINTYILPTLWHHTISIFTLYAFRRFLRHHQEPSFSHNVLPEQLKLFTMHLVHFKILKSLNTSTVSAIFWITLKTLIKTLLEFPSPVFTVLSWCWIFSTCWVEKLHFYFQPVFLMLY
jgi:hypothetical protein